MIINLLKTILPFILAIGLMACENDITEINRVIEQKEIAIEQAKGIEMLYSDSAIVKIRIKAPLMRNYLDKKEPKREFTNGVNVDIFNENKQIVSRLSAKFAIQLEKERKVTLQDSVVVVTTQNERLETEELIWDERAESIHTKKFVKMSTPTEIIYGTGFSSNLEFTKWRVWDVEGTLDVTEVMQDIDP